MEKVYSVKQIADHYDVSLKTVYNWISKHGMGNYMTKIGGRYGIMEKDMEAYLDSRKIGA